MLAISFRCYQVLVVIFVALFARWAYDAGHVGVVQHVIADAAVEETLPQWGSKGMLPDGRTVVQVKILDFIKSSELCASFRLPTHSE